MGVVSEVFIWGEVVNRLEGVMYVVSGGVVTKVVFCCNEVDI